MAEVNQSRPVTRYLRYKRGTERLVDWVVQTARTTLGRRGVKVTGDEHGKITTARLLELVEAICAEKSNVNVPPSIIVIAEDVIAGRRACADYYSSLDAAAPDEARTIQNAAHRHFITILEEITARLKNFVGAAQSRTKQKAKTLPALDESLASANIFDCLSIPEVEDTNVPHEPSSPKKSAPKKSTSPKHIYVDVDNEDRALHTWSLLQEVADIRNFLKEVWSQYHSGILSISVAIMVTDYALCNISIICGKMRSDGFQCGVSFEELRSILGVKIMISRGKLTLYARDGDDRAGTAASLLYVPAYNTLSHVRWHSGSDQVSYCDPIYDNSHDTIAKDMLQAAQNLQQFRPPNVWESPNSTFIGALQSDTLTWSLMALAKADGVPAQIPWLMVAATQVNRDIWCALGSDSSRAFAEISRCASWLLNTLVDSMSSPSALSSILGSMPTSKQALEDSLRALSEDKQSALSNLQRAAICLQHITGSDGPKYDYEEADDERVNDLLERLPMLSARALKDGLINRHYFCIELANEEQAILAMAYIYSAARAAGWIKGQWEDMDFVITEQNRIGRFLSSTDKQPLDFARHFSLAIGHDAKSWTRKPALTAKQRLQPRAKLSSTFRLVNEQLVVDKSSTESLSPAGLFAVQYRLYRALNPAKHKARNVALPNKDLLEALKTTLEQDDLSVKFDWLGFWRVCYEFLHTLASKASATLERLTNGRKDLKCFEIAHEVLWQAADPSIPRERTLLFQLRRVLNVRIENEGDCLLSQAKPFSSCHIPKAARPCGRWTYSSPAASDDPGTGEQDPVSARERAAQHQLDKITRDATNYYEDVLKRDPSLSKDARLKRITQWVDEQFKAHGLMRRALSTRENELGEPIFGSWDDTDKGWDPQDMYEVVVEGLRTLVNIDPEGLDLAIAKMPAKKRPKTDEERRALAQSLANRSVLSSENTRAQIDKRRQAGHLSPFYNGRAEDGVPDSAVFDKLPTRVTVARKVEVAGAKASASADEKPTLPPTRKPAQTGQTASQGKSKASGASGGNLFDGTMGEQKDLKKKMAKAFADL